MVSQFPNLFSPLAIRNVSVKNRIFSSAHGTMLAAGNVNDALIAYHEARARGGAGLVIVEVATVHPTALYSDHILNAESDECLPGYRRLAERVHAHDCRVFGQLFHPGREILHSQDGSATAAYAPSSVPNDRFHVMPRAMPVDLVREVIEGYGDAARRLKAAGLNGVEIVASQGYLPSQFLNPQVNRRDDEYGDSFENRLRFVREVVADMRSKVGDFVIGLRISGTEQDPSGLTDAEAADICAALDEPDGVDYFSVVTGTSATLGGSVHIAPPMFFEAGYVAPYAASVKARVSKPVFVAGRFNQPQIAERLLAAGEADMCAMTRALICDASPATRPASATSCSAIPSPAFSIRRAGASSRTGPSRVPSGGARFSWPAAGRAA
jgi:2,4-dienoyl-CoA reductase-like NADH-dependent reductase (Old Yellow Enzyme family)